MSLLPENDRILLGPGPSLTSPRVMRAMAAPTLSHLDPQMLALLDDVRARLARMFRAADGSFAFAVSGTGTSGMETAVANLVREGTRVLVVVTGYFGDRLAQMCERYGATVSRLDVEWGRACDPDALRRQLRATPADIVAMVHAETSTGVLNPVQQLAAIAREHGALTIVDAVTSSAAIRSTSAAGASTPATAAPRNVLAAPSGLAPVVFGPRALAAAREVPQLLFRSHAARGLLAPPEVSPHDVVDAGLRAVRGARDCRRGRARRALGSGTSATTGRCSNGLSALGLSVLPRDGERLWTLNAVRVPDGIDEAAVRSHLLDEFNIEIGAGLGPLAGKIWRVGLMGASSSPRLVVLLRGALESVRWRKQGSPGPCLSRHACCDQASQRSRLRRCMRSASRALGVWTARPTSLPHAAGRPAAEDEQSDDDRLHRAARRTRRARKGAPAAARAQRWVAYRNISPNLTRAVLVAEDDAFWQHEGVDFDQLQESLETDWARGRLVRGGSTITQQLAKNLYLSPSKNPLRKLRELLIARRLEAELKKARILELYLNVIEWGDGMYGAGAAARAYFGVSAADAVAVNESALLAAAIVNPRLLNPAHPTARLIRRQQLILRRMGVVTPPEEPAALVR